MKSKILIAITFLLAIHFGLFAEEIENENLSTEAKIDSIYKMQKKMYNEMNVSPLKNKKYGVELNLFRLLMWNDMISITGGFSLFDINRHAEIAFPIYFGKSQADHGTTEFDLDSHYRYFLGNNQKGFYLSGFARYTYLNGYFSNYNSYSYTYSYAPRTMNRFGMGIGLGYRIFSRKGLYWGTGLIVGKYFDSGYSDYYNSDLWYGLSAATSYIIDFELLKFGWAF